MKKLEKGGTIGIINPAYKNPKDVFTKYDYMIKRLKELGYNLKFGKTFTLENGYLAGTDIERANDVMDMFKDDSVDAILCMRGGYGCSRMVNLLDFDEIKKHPKIITGFSDITVLLNSIYQKCNFPTLHGLVGIYIGSSKCDKKSEEIFFDSLSNNQLNRVLKNVDDSLETYIDGTAEGILVGGNLCLLSTLCGSEFEIDFTDKIVFIEDVGEDPYRIDRYFSQLKLSKTFSKAKGFVLGYFTDCNPSEEKKDCQNIIDIINDYIKPLNKPTIINFNCGHDFPFVSLPIGVKVKLDATNKNIQIMEEIYE